MDMSAPSVSSQMTLKWKVVFIFLKVRKISTAKWPSIFGVKYVDFSPDLLHAKVFKASC